MPTAQVIIDRALRSLGVLRVGASASGDMQAEALAMLNELIDRASTDQLMVPQILTVTKALTPGNAEYTVGATQDIDIARPIDIEATSFIRLSGQDHALEKINRQQYNAIGAKSAQGMPDCIFYDDRYPVAYLYLYPVPDQAYTLHLNYQSPIAAFALASTSQSLPPAAESFLWTNLAFDLLPMYPNPDVAPLIASAAARSRLSFAKTNIRVPILRHTFASSGGYSAVSDS